MASAKLICFLTSDGFVTLPSFWNFPASLSICSLKLDMFALSLELPIHTIQDFLQVACWVAFIKSCNTYLHPILFLFSGIMTSFILPYFEKTSMRFFDFQFSRKFVIWKLQTPFIPFFSPDPRTTWLNMVGWVRTVTSCLCYSTRKSCITRLPMLISSQILGISSHLHS